MKKKLFFEDSKGNRLAAVLSDSEENKEKPIIILCHGFSSSKDSKTYLSFEKLLNKNKISTFRFDFYGHGESDGKFENITLSKAVDNILSAIKFLKNKGYNKVGLIGSSFGGMASIISASKSKEIYILGLKSPVSDYLGKIIAQVSRYPLDEWKKQGYIYYKNIHEKKFKLNYSFFEDAKNIQGYEAIKKIDIPTIIVHGDNDKSVPLEQSIKTSKIIENCRLEIIKGNDHYYSKKGDFETMLNLITDFIVKHSN